MSSKRLERRFVNSDQIDSQLFCSICSDVFLDPTRLLCGHTFCRKCITHWLHDKKSCPVCRKHTEETNMERDSRTNGIIDELEVHCPNSECTWKDKLLNLNKHYNTECSFTKNPEWLSQDQNYIQIEEDNINIPLEKTLGFSLNKNAQTPWLIRMEPPFGPHLQAPLVPMGFPIFMEEYYHRCPMYKVFAQQGWDNFEMKDKNMSMEILGSYFGEFSKDMHHFVPEGEIIIDENTTDESLQNKKTRRKRNTKKSEGEKEQKKTRKKRESRRATSTEKKKSGDKKGKRALVRHIVLDDDEEMFKDELQKKIKDTTVVL